MKLKILVDCRLPASNSCGGSAQQCQCCWVHKVQQASQWSTQRYGPKCHDIWPDGELRTCNNGVYQLLLAPV